MKKEMEKEKIVSFWIDFFFFKKIFHELFVGGANVLLK